MRTVVVIPAHNERGRVGRVAAVAMRALLEGVVQRVIVVDDGSTDGTAVEALAEYAEVLRLNPNRGKGGAMRAGFEAARAADAVMFLDADLLGLNVEHLRRMVVPVATGQAGMSLGLRDYGKWNAFQSAVPAITGERVVRADLLRAVPAEDWEGFVIEASINETCRRRGARVTSVVLDGLKMIPKWHKVGARQGFVDAARMSLQVLDATARARARVDAPPAAPAAYEAVVPAHNEGGRVGGVVRTLLGSRCFRRVLVVDDGSTDGTAAEAAAAGAQVVRLAPNRGKGAAMLEGARLTSAPWVAFFDGDLDGLTADHVRAMRDEAETGRYGMVNGVLVARRNVAPWSQLYALYGLDLTGQRFVHRTVMRRLPARYWSGYGVEVSLDEACARCGYARRRVLLEGLEATSQVEKLGPRLGVERIARILTEALRTASVVRADASW
jgi:glycosyltransferase involved in cell wall biosynthesis